jgi:hypothetical protein
MTTTELIELLKKNEKGASGRSREISFEIKNTRKSYIPEPSIEVCGTGDGICGAEVCLRITANK